ncbi:helix-turn-helix domain-containing protein [Streptomyces sp. RTd22]|uniref:helix-turn-helix domain-containing protein n=1 Tax=Streptomyces sp. RTd22 TaxID=1841249 RepID=UPI000A7DCE57|nr:helix-turn-helix domain-containing protein [Streptomyces sp. RTd22]
MIAPYRQQPGTGHEQRPVQHRGAELADRAGMSLRTFGRRFAREIGTTPLRWLNQQRVARARELLETTNLTIDTVAERSGLGTADGLRQHFHRTVGTTPATYRRAFGQEGQAYSGPSR